MQSLKHAIVTKLRTALPGRKLNALFDLKSTANGPELNLNSAHLRSLLGHNAGDLESLLGDVLPPSHSQRSTAKGISIAIDKDALFIETLRPLTSDPAPPNEAPPQQTVLVEFSSPNIAKPFHVGHLRSTIIGNFVANILDRHHRVHRINYLGDWGTQFGYVALGMRLTHVVSDEQFRADPIRVLFDAYVRAHTAAKSDPSLADQARQLFGQLEAAGDSDSDERSAELAQWRRIREHTVDELRTTYTRLGVRFDEYCWESDYRRQRIQPLLDEMSTRRVLTADVASDAHIVQLDGGKRTVPLLKSDGSTVYLARDCAALQDRAARFAFDRMLYVVDNGQHDHFRNLIDVGRQMGMDGVDGVEHVKFGRIQGMSTREGKVVFLRDILDEARDRMFEKQRQTHTTRVDLGSGAGERGTADVLGMSAVIVNDLKQRRTRDYVFDWDAALQMNGDTGIKLQYTHCRLCSLAETCEDAGDVVDGGATTAARLEMLREPEAERLLLEMARYADVLERSEETLEACVLVVYLFGLCNAINRALTKLNVRKQSDGAVRAQRLLLFGRAREILHDGMLIVGLQPLRRM